jgi:5-methylcytosine-specific restriction endonuclease McrA
MRLAAGLTDDALTLELARLAGREREATAAFIAHLGEFAARRLYEGAGYPSMFAYCRAVLWLSEDAAYNRIKAAQAARDHPEIVEMLAEGSLSLTTVRLLAPHLTSENHETVLAAARGLGKEGVAELVVRLSPQPDVAASVRKLPARASHAAIAASAGVASAVAGGATSSPPPIPPAIIQAGIGPTIPSFTSSASPKPAVVRPLAPERYEIRFTADGETRRLLREAQDLLAHALPSGDLASVFHRALALLVTDLKRRKFAATSKPRTGRGPKVDSRTPAASVRREVSARDTGRCGFVSPDGHRCEETRFLEFHHVVPYARGGRATVENIQLRCRAHNGYEVDLFFGRGRRWVKNRAGVEKVTRSGTGATPLLSG